MGFQISGLPITDFAPLFDLDDDALAARGIVRRKADAKPGYPCRITLRDAEPGDSVLLLNHVSHDVASPYRASYAIFVNEAADETRHCVNAIPETLQGRPVSLRGFAADGTLVDARLALQGDVADRVESLFENSRITEIHAHNAAHGCFAARITRA